MKKDSFIKGMFAAYAAIVITKILGVVYSIPFYDIIGEEGGVIYSCVYNIYALFLDISTCGIPVAVSILISEYHTLEKYRTERRAYSTALRIVTFLSILTFAAMQLFAGTLSQYFLKDMSEGASPDAVTLGIRIISFCMLIVPFLSLRRGLLQGYKYVAVSSQSQVIEQFVRIVIALAGSYIAIKVIGLSNSTGVNTAFTGTVLGALVSLIYVTIKSRSVKEEMLSAEGDASDDTPVNQIIRRFISICVPIIFVSLTVSIYSVVDMKLILVGLHGLNYADAEAQIIASVASTWAPKICMLISALPMGIVSSIVPFMAESNAEKNREDVTNRLNQAIGVLLMVSVPIAAGMIVLRDPLYTLFYGRSDYGPGILALLVIVNLIGGIASVMSSTMQSVGYGKAVFLCTFFGILVNVGLDLPLIYLYDRIGIPSYLGAATASIIGQVFTVIVQGAVLKKGFGYSARSLFRDVFRILLATAVMTAVVVLILLVWPAAEYRSIKMIIQLAVCAIAGALIYFIIVFFSGTAENVVGRKELDGLLDRFHIRTIVSAVMFFPALWAGKLVRWHYIRTGRRRSDKPGMASMLLCSEFLRFIRKPKLTIVVTGTNGKSTISNLLAEILKMDGRTVAYNDWGANHYAGNARCLLDAVDIFNRSTADAAVIELDEKISPINLPKLRPDYIIVNNIARDSMLRNANVEFIESLLRKGLESVPDTVAVLNADDPLCIHLGEKNRRIYFGAEDLHTDPLPNTVSDFTSCPNCGTKPVYEYRNFRHIGYFICPQCGLHTPERDLTIVSCDRERSAMTVSYRGKMLTLSLVSPLIHNIYNEAAVAALCLDLGMTPEKLSEYLSGCQIPAMRETEIEIAGMRILTRAAKGRNTAAVSSVLEAVSKEPGKKELILMLDEENKGSGKYETASWIYEIDYSALNKDTICRVVIAGANCFDHRVALLMSGFPADRITCTSDLNEPVDLVDITGINSIYVIHDVYYASRSITLRDAIKERIEKAGCVPDED